MSDDVDAVRSRIDIVELVRRQVPLKQAGKNWKGLCPFHEDRNPSFHVNPTLGVYRCWACGEKGDIFTWVMKTQRVEFPEALRILAQEAGVELKRQNAEAPQERKKRASAMEDALAFFRTEFERSELAKGYVASRDLDDETVTAWELGYAPEIGEALAIHLQRQGHALTECRDLYLVHEDATGAYYDVFRGRLMFPIRDERGALVAFGGRIIGAGQPKYVNSGDTPLFRKSRLLYGMHRAKDAIARDDQAVLVEGYLDVIACHRGGVETAVASLGTSLTPDQAKLIRRWTANAVILYDADDAGYKAADRAIEVLQAEGIHVRIAAMPPGDDPDTLLAKGGAVALREVIDTAVAPLDYRLRRIEETIDSSSREFWTEVIDLLAAAPSQVDVERHMLRLARQVPGVPDLDAAVRSLRMDIRQRRLSRARSETPSQQATAPTHLERARQLDPAESAIFGGLLLESTRREALDAVGDLDLFVTELGRRVAAEVSAIGRGVLEVPCAVWLGRIEDADVREAIIAAEYPGNSNEANRRFFHDSLTKLRKHHAARNVSQMKTQEPKDEVLVEILARLRDLKS